MRQVGNDGSLPPAIALAASGSAADIERARRSRSAPEIVALAFSMANAGLRMRVLGRLVQSVGTLALAVIGGGAFVKCLLQARSVSVEDVALLTSSQIFELARYVQQSNPAAIEQVLGLLAHDVSTMNALGASVAVLAIDLMPQRRPLRPALRDHVRRVRLMSMCRIGY